MMRLGKVIGKLWATVKDPQLTGVKLFILQPMTKEQQPTGTPIIVADAVGSGEGDVVYWVSSREATFALQGKRIPSDATIVGIVDSIYLEPDSIIREKMEK